MITDLNNSRKSAHRLTCNHFRANGRSVDIASSVSWCNGVYDNLSQICPDVLLCQQSTHMPSCYVSYRLAASISSTFHLTTFNRQSAGITQCDRIVDDLPEFQAIVLRESQIKPTNGIKFGSQFERIFLVRVHQIKEGALLPPSDQKL